MKGRRGYVAGDKFHESNGAEMILFASVAASESRQ
jgi:hypothetical protein